MKWFWTRLTKLSATTDISIPQSTLDVGIGGLELYLTRGSSARHAGCASKRREVHNSLQENCTRYRYLRNHEN